MSNQSSLPSYRLTDNELAVWLRFIEYQVGFVLPVMQQVWIKGIIERYLLKLKMPQDQFLKKISHDETLLHQFFDEILIPRTQFFRHLPTFEVLAHYATRWKQVYYRQSLAELTTFEAVTNTATPNDLTVPELTSHHFTAWSVGCATGQESVSLALTLSQVFTPVSRFDVWASDFHHQALATAKQGRYDVAEMAFIPHDFFGWLQIKQGKHFEALPTLQERIHYFEFNLMQRQKPLPVAAKQCQVIMCQNVLIYFRQFEQRDIIQFLSQYLADDGILIMGIGEAGHINNSGLKKLPSSKVDILVKSDAPEWLMRLPLV